MEGWVGLGWLVTWWDSLLAWRQSPIALLTGLTVAQLHWSRPTRYRYTKPPPMTLSLSIQRPQTSAKAHAVHAQTLRYALSPFCLTSIWSHSQAWSTGTVCWHQTQPKRWFMRSSAAGLTTVTHCCLALPTNIWSDYSQFRMQLPVWWLVHDAPITSLRCWRSSTGCQSDSAYSTRWRCWCTSA